MASADIPLLDLAEQRLAWVDRRQGVLARNIANANTPGWQARDLIPFSAELANAGLAPTQTNPLHLPGKGPAASRARTSAPAMRNVAATPSANASLSRSGTSGSARKKSGR